MNQIFNYLMCPVTEMTAGIYQLNRVICISTHFLPAAHTQIHHALSQLLATHLLDNSIVADLHNTHHQVLLIVHNSICSMFVILLHYPSSQPTTC